MKFSLDDIKNDHCIKDFIRSREIRTSTIYEYARRIRDYSNYIGKGPSELIDEAESDEDKGIRLRNRKVSRYVLDFVENMEKKGMSENSVKGYLEVITAFYHYFDISTPRIKRNKKTTMNKAFEKIPNIEDVRKAVKVVSLRDKAIVLLMLSSGMGKSEIIHLKYGDFLNAIDDYLDLNDEDRINVNKIAQKLEKQKDAIGTWKIKRYKTNMPFITFNSPESTNAIIDYLADKNKRNNQHKSGEDPLFYSLQNKKLSTTAFNAIFQRINDRVGFPVDAETNRRYFTSHKLRKLFTTTLYNQGVDILAVDWMLGHRINPITQAYFKNDPTKLKASYMTAVDKLTLEKIKVKTLHTKAYDHLLEKLMKKEEDYKNLEKRVELMENFLADKSIQDELNKR